MSIKWPRAWPHDYSGCDEEMNKTNVRPRAWPCDYSGYIWPHVFHFPLSISLLAIMETT